MATVKICIATSDRLQSHCQASLDKLLLDAGREQGVLVSHEILKSCYIYTARNWLIGGSWCVEQALEQAALYDYYWMIDSDIGGYDLPLLKALIDLHVPVATVPYAPKTANGTVVCGMLVFEERPALNVLTSRKPIHAPPMQAVNVSKYVDCDWSGMGCVLFHKSVFTELLPFPWFYPDVWRYENNGFRFREVIGEDVAISWDLYSTGVKFRIYPHALEHKVDVPCMSCGFLAGHAPACYQNALDKQNA